MGLLERKLESVGSFEEHIEYLSKDPEGFWLQTPLYMSWYMRNKSGSTWIVSSMSELSLSLKSAFSFLQNNTKNLLKKSSIFFLEEWIVSASVESFLNMLSTKLKFSNKPMNRSMRVFPSWVESLMRMNSTVISKWLQRVWTKKSSWISRIFFILEHSGWTYSISLSKLSTRESWSESLSRVWRLRKAKERYFW